MQYDKYLIGGWLVLLFLLPGAGKIGPVSHHSSAEFLFFCSVMSRLSNGRPQHKLNLITLDYSHPNQARPGLRLGDQTGKGTQHLRTKRGVTDWQNRALNYLTFKIPSFFMLLVMGFILSLSESLLTVAAHIWVFILTIIMNLPFELPTVCSLLVLSLPSLLSYCGNGG